MKKFINKIIPRQMNSVYHFCLAIIAAVFYGFPSRKMVVIGITGTKGKTSTANFIWSALNTGGLKTGIITTANIRIGNDESLNHFHMTMPGRFAIQGLMKKMAKAGCKYCIVETTSEGIKQFRHIGINYDIAVFTNLSPEHLPSHGGSFENYKNAKKKLFKALSKNEKVIDGKKVEKIIIANADSEHAVDFLAHDADKKITFGVDVNSTKKLQDSHMTSRPDYTVYGIKETDSGVAFTVRSDTNPRIGTNTTNATNSASNFQLSIPGIFNVFNALPAIIISKLAGISDEIIAQGLINLKLIPGRMEKIDLGQDFTVFVDYAHEKQSMTGVLQTAQNMVKNAGQSKLNTKIADGINSSQTGKIIVLLGAEGGGRDKKKRAEMGEIVAKMADYVICSNVDPYDDDPKEIVEDIAIVAEKFGKIRNQNLFVIEDRRSGIVKALSLAKTGDIVIFTGKGAEQSMIIGGQSIPWDDREVVKEELKKMIPATHKASQDKQ